MDQTAARQEVPVTDRILFWEGSHMEDKSIYRDRPGPEYIEFQMKRPGVNFGIGGCLDVETTGLSPYNNEVVEFGLVLFMYNRETAEITGIIDQYTGLREPGCPISRGASRVHGLTKRSLTGKCLDNEKILTLIKQAELIISHNVSFDYGFVAPLFPLAATKPWYCSMSGICWRKKGFNSRGLQNLLLDHGIEVRQSHRALDDARAVISLLGKRNDWGLPYLHELLSGNPLKVAHRAAGK